MKHIPETTIGGRIRRTREDLGITLREFAPKIGVTPNHLSLVERNEKPAPPTLLRKIAECADISIDWLRYGSPRESTQEEPRQDDTGYLPSNMQSFLELAMEGIPNIDKSVLSAILNISKHELDEILNGKQPTPQEHWQAAFEMLSQRLDIEKMQQELAGIESRYLKLKSTCTYF